MEPVKHECGVALIRLLRPLQYYVEKYGTASYALEKLYLLMEKQHNRGQEAAGIGVIKLNSSAGNEYIYRERALGANAISEIFDIVGRKISDSRPAEKSTEEIDSLCPFIGQLYMGHLRYSTTGRSGLSYVHPFLRRNNWPSRNLLLCGNFNLTNVDEIFEEIVSHGQHPRIYSDTIMLLEQIGYALDRENHRLYRKYRDNFSDPILSEKIENEMDMINVISSTAPSWDGGFVICGATGSGDMFVVRDANGIRPAFYYHDDEIVVVASERPVIQIVFNKTCDEVKELQPGCALTVNKHGLLKIDKVLKSADNRRCSFERIYFSRGSDASIYNERKNLGRNLVPDIMSAIGNDLDHTVFSFIPNTAEVAFLGMCEGLEHELDILKTNEILRLNRENKNLNVQSVVNIMNRRLRIEKVAIKDIKLRTFIAEGNSRNNLAAHVYDITYGCINPGTDTLVVIDDSIVRGTTLRQSIIGMLDRLRPRHIVIVSSSPQVRYPDCYGIDMSRMAEFIAFKAAVSLLCRSGREFVLKEVYEMCLKELEKPAENQKNCVKHIYAPFSDKEISDEIVRLLKPEGTKADVTIVYQTVEGLHRSITSCPGDWYFTGDYPTPGGVRLVNRAFVNYYEGNESKR